MHNPLTQQNLLEAIKPPVVFYFTLLHYVKENLLLQWDTQLREADRHGHALLMSPSSEVLLSGLFDSSPSFRGHFPYVFRVLLAVIS